MKTLLTYTKAEKHSDCDDNEILILVQNNSPLLLAVLQKGKLRLL